MSFLLIAAIIYFVIGIATALAAYWFLGFIPYDSWQFNTFKVILAITIWPVAIAAMLTIWNNDRKLAKERR